MTFRTPGEERKCGRGLSSNSVCLIHNNLRTATTYFFCVRAFNAAGSSEMSEVVSCTTLSYGTSSLPGTRLTSHTSQLLFLSSFFTSNLFNEN